MPFSGNSAWCPWTIRRPGALYSPHGVPNGRKSHGGSTHSGHPPGQHFHRHRPHGHAGPVSKSPRSSRSGGSLRSWGSELRDDLILESIKSKTIVLLLIAPTARWILMRRTDAQSAGIPIKISYLNAYGAKPETLKTKAFKVSGFVQVQGFWTKLPKNPVPSTGTLRRSSGNTHCNNG